MEMELRGAGRNAKACILHHITMSRVPGANGNACTAPPAILRAAPYSLIWPHGSTPLRSLFTIRILMLKGPIFTNYSFLERPSEPRAVCAIYSPFPDFITVSEQISRKENLIYAHSLRLCSESSW
jgi:hypothetical protein